MELRRFADGVEEFGEPLKHWTSDDEENLQSSQDEA